MYWLNADLVQATGIAIATVVGALTAWQARQVRQLRERIEALEDQLAEDRSRFKAAVRMIRALLRHIEELGAFIKLRTGEAPPANPVAIPTTLEDEL
ncbi:hypothetical protein [Nocardia sp. NPDC052566]|uniref:hypothetical protein n=1 Tax=Nocardia sp. NPDC052566 TaxID=3364330 RepID=UPI0037C99E99